MLSNHIINGFKNKFQELWSIIKDGKSNEGFIKNVVDRLLPFLHWDPATKDIVTDWNNQLKAESYLVYHAYRELSCAVNEIHTHSEDDSATLQFLNEILEEVKKQGSCAFLKEPPYPYDLYYYKLKSLYAQKVVKGWDFTFAPSALTLIKQLNPSSVQTRSDTDPKFLWSQLLCLQEYWSYVGDIISVWWPRIEASGLELWLQAHAARREAFFKMVAGILQHVDLPCFDKDYFDREHFHTIIQRLFSEICLILSSDFPAPQMDMPVPDNKDTKTEKYQKDLGRLSLIFEELRKTSADPEKTTQEELMIKVAEQIMQGAIIGLYNPTITLLKKAARKGDFRIEHPRGKGKKFNCDLKNDLFQKKMTDFNKYLSAIKKNKKE